jgi:hypothetical protein
MEDQTKEKPSKNALEKQTRFLINSMADRNATELIRSEKGLTIDNAIKGKKNCEILKAFGEHLTVRAYSGAIIMSTEFFNTGHQMSEMQAIQTASLLIEQYPVETFEDLLLCMKNAKIGKYGKVFNRVDGLIIFEWFRLYLNEKYERFEQIKHEESMTYRTDISQNILPFAEQILEASKKAIEKQGKQKHETSGQINDKMHFESFKQQLVNLNKEELIALKKNYETENKKTFTPHFNHYLEAIINKLKTQ